MNNFLTKFVIPAALACAAAGTHAAVVQYDFTVTGANAPAGAGGSFSIESTAGSAPNVFGETEFALLSFSFSFGAAAFDLSGLFGDAGLAIFDGATLRGLEAVGDNSAFSFMPGTANTAPFLVWASATAGPLSFDLSFQPRQNQVPEPGTAWLVSMLGAAA